MNDKLLLAISGGVDSVVLMHLMIDSGISFSMAHCNFYLRGEESDRDEAFVRELASQFNIELFVKGFKTSDYAQENGVSIEMAARELRYDWFNELCDGNGLKYVVTAHHKNDSIETVLLNLIRGTGIKGLTGIKYVNNNIIRPLLFASRNQIVEYSTENNLAFVSDSSNDELIYKRNIIRNKLVPIMKELNPDIINTLDNNSQILNEVNKILEQSIASAYCDVVDQRDDEIWIDIEKLKKNEPIKTYLYEFISRYGFTFTVVENIISVLDKESGSLFYSQTHALLKDREFLIIKESVKPENYSYLIRSVEELTYMPHNLKVSLIGSEKFEIIDDNNIACIDLEKVKFPLEIRKWDEGDKFKPLGMSGYKKLSDFFSDIKLNNFQKQEVWLLTAENEIVWVMGYRIDDRYKITDTTTTILKIHFGGFSE